MTDDVKKEKAQISPEEARRILREIKQKVFDLEKGNQEYIYIYYSGKGWHKCGGNSAQFLFHIVAPKTNGLYSPKINPDRDYNYVFPTGVISIRDMTKFREAMEVADVHEDKDNKPHQGFIHVFTLPKKIKEDELHRILKIDEAKRQELGATLSLATCDPELAALIREFQKNTFTMVKQLKTVEREMVGNRIIGANTELYMAYHDWANGVLDEEAGINQMIKIINQLCCYVLMMMESDVLTTKQVATYTFKLESMRNILKKRLKFYNGSKTKDNAT